MTDSTRSGGVDVTDGATVGEDIVGRDKIVSTTNSYAGLTIGDMFRLRLVMSYERLWGLLEPLARYGRTAPFTAEAARALSERLRAWYFQEAGGMYLYFSPRLGAHHAYMELQRGLKQIIDATNVEALTASLPDDTLAAAQGRAHDLRRAMTAEMRDYMQANTAEPPPPVADADELPSS